MNRSTRITNVFEHSQILGANLRALRENNDITLEDVAKHCTISTSLLSQIEAGKRSINGMLLRDITLFLQNMPLGYFLSLLYRTTEDAKELAINESLQYSDVLLCVGSQQHVQPKVIQYGLSKRTTSHQTLAIELPPTSQLYKHPIQIQSSIVGVIHHGTLLVDFCGDEHVFTSGSYFEYNGKLPHFMRNFKEIPCHFTLFLPHGGW